MNTVINVILAILFITTLIILLKLVFSKRKAVIGRSHRLWKL